MDGWKCALKPLNQRVRSVAGPIGLGGLDIPFGDQIIKDHNAPRTHKLCEEFNRAAKLK
jgi:hypothetical protein